MFPKFHFFIVFISLNFVFSFYDKCISSLCLSTSRTCYFLQLWSLVRCFPCYPSAISLSLSFTAYISLTVYNARTSVVLYTILFYSDSRIALVLTHFLHVLFRYVIVCQLQLLQYSQIVYRVLNSRLNILILIMLYLAKISLCVFRVIV